MILNRAPFFALQQSSEMKQGKHIYIFYRIYSDNIRRNIEMKEQHIKEHPLMNEGAGGADMRSTFL